MSTLQNHEPKEGLTLAINVDETRVTDHLKSVVRSTVEETLNAMLDQEADELCRAKRYERTPDRVDTRAGHYERKLQTAAGQVTLQVPKLRTLPFESQIIERYKRRESSVEEALVEMYLAGVSVRRVEDITEALWGARVSASTVSELNQKIYGTIEEWRNQPIERTHPYVYLDGIWLKRSWGSMLNRLICVQSKATDHEWAGETEDQFSYSCKSDDIEYWRRGNVPVILICSRPRTAEAYWISINEAFADPHRRASCKIVFDKKRNRFDASAAPALLRLALDHEAGIHVMPQRLEETLWMNLMPVRYPSSLWTAQTSMRRGADMHAALRERGAAHLAEWVLTGSTILSVHPLDTPPWDGLCDRSTVTSMGAHEWAMADNQRQWQFASLLGLLLREKVKPDLEWSRVCECFFFRPETQQAVAHPRTLTYHSLKNRVSRDVVTKVFSKKDPAVVTAWRHHAFGYQFMRLGSQWLLAIEPTYYFSAPDTGRLHPSSHKMVSALRRLEKNQAILGQTQMWSSYLSREADLFHDVYPHLQILPLLQARCDGGFQEDGWFDLEADDDEDDDGDDQIGTQQEILP